MALEVPPNAISNLVCGRRGSLRGTRLKSGRAGRPPRLPSRRKGEGLVGSSNQEIHLPSDRYGLADLQQRRRARL